jgi:hypothetical protein
LGGTAPGLGAERAVAPGGLRESLSRGTTDALEHLRHAIEMSEEFRDSAKHDSDLDPIRDEPAFKQLITD